MNEALYNDFGKTALEMALISELSSQASTQLNIDFYQAKLQSGKSLDTNEIADKAFWERNLEKIEEKIEFLRAKLEAEGIVVP